MQICNPRSTPKCCETGKLSSLLSDDWSKNDKETWKNKDLGPCKTRTWDARGGFDVAVKKAGGKDSLKVTNITLEIADDGILKPTAKDISKYVVISVSNALVPSTGLPAKTTHWLPKTQ